MPVGRRRAEHQHLLRRAEQAIDAATLRAIAAWLDALRFALVDELAPRRIAAAADYAVDAAVARTWGVWQDQLEQQMLPTVSVAFGDAFQQVRRADPNGAFRLQQQYLAEVSDRLRIWPAGAFEDIRPELIESLSDAVTIDEMTERIGRVLSIDAKSRKLRAQIGDVESQLADPDLDPADRPALTQWRRDLWEQHDESLNEWQWKARRIARTESHGAVSAGQLAAAKLVEQQTGLRMWKRWLSTEDTRTRASHRVADGQACPLDEPFRVGGFLLQHPADSISVAPHEVINCRCTMLIYDDDELQDEFDDQGGKGPVEPGSVRIGPDDADAADDAIAAVADAEDRALPRLGQRGEDYGQNMPAQPLDVEVTDEREPIPMPDLETASDQRLADYLIRTDERDGDPELRDEVDAELTRRRESEQFEAQIGRPPDADDVIEVDDDDAWLDEFIRGDEDDAGAEDVVEPDPDYDPDYTFDDWVEQGDDRLPDDAVPDDPIVPEPMDDAGDLDLDDVEARYEQALEEFTRACESGDDDDEIERTARAMDAAEAERAEALARAEVVIEPDVDEPAPTADVPAGEPTLDAQLEEAEGEVRWARKELRRDDVDDEYRAEMQQYLDNVLGHRDDLLAQVQRQHDDQLAAERARERAEYARAWGEAAAAEEYDREPERRQLTPAEQKRIEIMRQADEYAEAHGVTYEQALAEVQNLDVDQVRRREFVAEARNHGLTSTNYGDLLSELHRRNVLDWMLQAEDDCRGQLLKPYYRDKGGFDHTALWEVNDVTARKYMSDEMAEWFDEHGGRITKADLERMIEGGLGHAVFDAESCLGEWARWPGRRIGGDYLQ